MGFGRTGRNLFRILYKREDVRIVAIDEIAAHEAIEYLLRFDSLLGPFPDPLTLRDGHLYVYGRQIPVLSNRSPADVPWGELGADVVVEAAGVERSREELEGHLERGARRVILCAPPKEPPDLTVVMGVNDGDLGPEHRIISNASSTAHAAGPVLKLLHGAFGIERAFLSSVHAYSNQHRLADVPAEDPRLGRAAAENIIPQRTNAGTLVMEILPDLEGRVTAHTINVPVPNGSVVDLVCWHEREVTPTAINELIRTGAVTCGPGVLRFVEEPIVSRDVIRSPYSGTFDAEATMVLGGRISKTLTWYDNGWGYAHRVVDLIQRLATIESRGVS
jgi:glyceraldehyde 3-phosphate dehydrogenase